MFVTLLCALVLSSCSRESRSPVTEQNDSSHDTSGFSVGASARGLSAGLDQRREELLREGRYNCCARPGCTECIADLDSCDCYAAIMQKEPICGECLASYKEGHGKLKLVSIVELEQIRKGTELKKRKP